MPRQFDVYRRDNGQLLVVLQHDSLDELRTRAVAPLLQVTTSDPGLRLLGPQIVVDDRRYYMALHSPMTATQRELGSFVASAAHLRGEIIRGLDLLFTGV